MLRRISALAILAAWWAFTALAVADEAASDRESSAAEAQEPAAVVARLHAKLVEAMRQADALGFRGRYDSLAPVVTATFDLSAVARFAVGRHWSEFSQSQQDAYVDAFRRITIGTYADRFDGYEGQRFECNETREVGAQRRLVRCRLLREPQSPVQLDYMLQQTVAGWRIVNVYASGVSDLAVKRQQYQHVIETEGIDALIRRLGERADELGEPG